jgi:hypothetical protein
MTLQQSSTIDLDLQMLSIPTFPEAEHQIVESLANYSDRELIDRHRAHPEQGRYFTALFCRYSAIVYSTIQHAVESREQTDYLFAIVWRQIFRELQRVQLPQDPEATNWQNWIMDIAGNTISGLEIPPPNQIRYAMNAAPPPLWCYLERGLDRISPLSRLIVVMTQSLKWNAQRISAYLQGEGQYIPAASTPTHLAEGYRRLEAALPEDIRLIYLGNRELGVGSNE